jgi:hypothetical protein
LQKTFFFLSKVYKNYIANSILVIFFFLNVNKKRSNQATMLQTNPFLAKLLHQDAEPESIS